jgi:hypothetical protein
MKSQEEAIQQFIIFCLESYKVDKHLTGAEALRDFEQYDIFSYLAEGYDVLHTQGQAYLVADIKDFIRHRQKEQTT